MHEGVFDTTRLRTHIRFDQRLLRDRTVWNKVYRTEFWRHHGLHFLDRTYEDGPVTVRGHLEAETVDVVAQVVYWWRRRERGEHSITQRPPDADALLDRLRQVRVVSRYLSLREPDLKRLYDQEMVDHDLLIVAAAVGGLDASERDLILSGLATALKRMSSSVTSRSRRGWLDLARSFDHEGLSRLLRDFNQTAVL